VADSDLTLSARQIMPAHSPTCTSLVFLIKQNHIIFYFYISITHFVDAENNKAL